MGFTLVPSLAPSFFPHSTNLPLLSSRRPITPSFTSTWHNCWQRTFDSLCVWPLFMIDTCLRIICGCDELFSELTLGQSLFFALSWSFQFSSSDLLQGWLVRDQFLTWDEPAWTYNSSTSEATSRASVGSLDSGCICSLHNVRTW